MNVNEISMYLTTEEEKMLKGEMGSSRQWAMEYLVKYSEALKAERFVKASSVSGSFSLRLKDEMPPEAYEDLLKKGYPVPLYSHLQPEMEFFNEAGYTLEEIKEQRETNKICGQVGSYLCGSCAPYIVGWIPVFGTIAPTGESSHVPYQNSVFGARSNKESLSLSRIAIAGRVPYCGLYTDEGRKGTIQVKVETELEEEADWGAMGDWVGRLHKGRPSNGLGGDIPVFTGIERFGDVRVEHLKGLGGAVATTGDCGMYHIVGYTPEAHTLEMAFQDDKPLETVTFGKKELKESYDQISSHGPDRVDAVVFGCPHYTIHQLTSVARLLEGKKVKKGVKFWILTPPFHREMARLTGIYDIIRDSGALILSHCWGMNLHEPYLIPSWEILPERDTPPKTPTSLVIATDSPKVCFYAPMLWRGMVDVWFGKMKDCVNAALTGKWNTREN